MSYPFYIFLGLAPSIIWLLFFLRKDAHPESNRMVLKIFLYGGLATIPVFLIETGISEGLDSLNLSPIIAAPLYWFIGIALTEEVLKYFVVRWKVLKHPEFDEPIDAMLYMIIAALGFAALENILVLFSEKGTLLFSEAVVISSFRFIGATFLHALCSGAVGFFLALSFFEPKKRLKLIIAGIGIAALLHGLFNIFIIQIEDASYFIIIPIIILINLALFVTYGFKKLKKLKSVCKLK